MKNIKYLYPLILFALILALGSCIPIRKQLILIHPKKPNLSSIQKMDTIVNKKPFEYKIRCGDQLTIGVKTLNFEGITGLNEALQAKSNMLLQTQGQVVGSGNAPANQENGFYVNDSGYVNIPVLGSLYLKGKTIEEAESLVNQMASKYFNHTITSLTVGFNYTMFTLNSGAMRTATSSRTTLLDVITQNAIPEFGNLQKIKIIRRTNDNRGYHIYYVNLNNIQLVSEENFYVFPGDIIVVEPHRLKNFTTYFLRNVGLATTFISIPLLLISVLNTFRRI